LSGADITNAITSGWILKRVKCSYITDGTDIIFTAENEFENKYAKECEMKRI